MAMPKGDSLRQVHDFYQYLQGHQLAPHGRTVTWHVDWSALAWLWGFVLVLGIVLALWIRDYRSTRPQTGIMTLDSWSGYTSEAAGRVPVFFWVLLVVIVGSGAEFVIGHLINGQVF